MKIETAVVARDKDGLTYSSMETIVALKTQDYLYYFAEDYFVCFDLECSWPTRFWEIGDLRYDVPIGSFIDELRARSVLDENEVVTNAYTEEQFCFKLCMDD